MTPFVKCITLAGLLTAFTSPVLAADQPPLPAQAGTEEWVWRGAVGSIDPQRGWLTLEDGSTFRLPSTATTGALPQPGDSVQILASYVEGQQVIRQLETGTTGNPSARTPSTGTSTAAPTMGGMGSSARPGAGATQPTVPPAPPQGPGSAQGPKGTGG